MYIVSCYRQKYIFVAKRTQSAHLVDAILSFICSTHRDTSPPHPPRSAILRQLASYFYTAGTPRTSAMRKFIINGRSIVRSLALSPPGNRATKLSLNNYNINNKYLCKLYRRAAFRVIHMTSHYTVFHVKQQIVKS